MERVVGAVLVGATILTGFSTLACPCASPTVAVLQDGAVGVLTLDIKDGVDQVIVEFPGIVDVFAPEGGRVVNTPHGGVQFMVPFPQGGALEVKWRPGILTPMALTLVGSGLEERVELSKWAIHPPEVQFLPRGAVVGRAGGPVRWIRLTLSEEPTGVRCLGVGGNPTWSVFGREILIQGPFPNGTGVLVEWWPGSARLESAEWEDRPAYIAGAPGVRLSGFGFTWEASFSWAMLGEGEVVPEAVAVVSAASGPFVEYLWESGGWIGKGPQFALPLGGNRTLVTLVATDVHGYRHVRQEWIEVPGFESEEEEPPLPPPPGWRWCRVWRWGRPLWRWCPIKDPILLPVI